MTDFKIPSEGGLLVVSSTNGGDTLTFGESDIMEDYDQRIIYDYPAYYYNKKRADQHYARDFAHRLLGVAYKSPYGEKK